MSFAFAPENATNCSLALPPTSFYQFAAYQPALEICAHSSGARETTPSLSRRIAANQTINQPAFVRCVHTTTSTAKDSALPCTAQYSTGPHQFYTVVPRNQPLSQVLLSAGKRIRQKNTRSCSRTVRRGTQQKRPGTQR